MKREKISPHFYRDEYRCLCGCGFDAVDRRLNEIHEELREYFGVPVHIVKQNVPDELNGSACRCAKHNKAVGGVEGSDHELGKAGDTTIEGVTPERVYMYLDSKYPYELALGLYKTFVHIGIRNYRARWAGKGVTRP